MFEHEFWQGFYVNKRQLVCWFHLRFSQLNIEKGIVIYMILTSYPDEGNGYHGYQDINMLLVLIRCDLNPADACRRKVDTYCNRWK